MHDLDFDLSRSLKVKANGAISKSMYDFLFNFNGNHGPICKRFQVTALRNMRDLGNSMRMWTQHLKFNLI